MSSGFFVNKPSENKLAAIVQSPSHVWFFVTPWTAACQASLSISISWSLPKFMSIALVMPSSAFNLSQHQGLFQRVGCLYQVAKVLANKYKELNGVIVYLSVHSVSFNDQCSVVNTLDTLRWPWANSSSFLCLFSFICKMKIMPKLQGWKVKWPTVYVTESANMLFRHKGLVTVTITIISTSIITHHHVISTEEEGSNSIY